jgi:hypothetical protein
LLREEDFTLLINELSYELDILAGKIKSIDVEKILDRMGFPVNFREIARVGDYGQSTNSSNIIE